MDTLLLVAVDISFSEKQFAVFFVIDYILAHIYLYLLSVL